MKEFQTVVDDLVYNHKKHTRYVAILTALCMVVSIVVPVSLIKPAISFSGELTCGIEEHTHSSSCYDENGDLVCSLAEHIHSQDCYAQLDETALKGENGLEYALLANEDINSESQDAEVLDTFEDENVQDFEVVEDTEGTVQGIQSEVTLDSQEEESEVVEETTANRFSGFGVVKDDSDTTNATTTDSTAGTKYTYNNEDYIILGILSGDVNGVKNNSNTANTSLVEFIANYSIGNSFLSTVDGRLYINVDGTPGNIAYFAISVDTSTITDIASRFTGAINGNKNTGSYIIEFDPTTGKGLVTLNFTDNYMQSVQNTTNGLSGKITFRTTISRDKNSYSDLSYNYGDFHGTIDTFGSKEVTLNKTAKLNSNGTITWTITATADSEVDWNNFYITDTMLSDSSFTKDSSSTQGSRSGSKYTFGKVTSKTATLKYTTASNYSAVNEKSETKTNTASIYSTYDSTTKELANTTATVTLNPVSVSKEGTINSDGNIAWTILVDNPSYCDLSNSSLSDSYLKDAKDFKVEVSTDGNSYSDVSGATVSNGTYTYNGRPRKLRITYTTTPTVNGKIFESSDNTSDVTLATNKVTIAGHSDTASVKYTPISASKSGYLNPSTNEITWTITINNPSHIDLEGITVSDSMLSSDSVVSNSITSTGNVLSTTSPYTLGSSRAGKITITYRTKLNNPSVSGGTVSNDVTLTKDKDNETYYAKTANVTYTGVTINKSGYYNSTTKAIDWTITVYNTYGADLGGVTISDSMFQYATNFSNINGKLDESKNFVFNAGVIDKTINIEYSTPLDKLDGESVLENSGTYVKSTGGTIVNTATLNKDGYTPAPTSKAEVPVEGNASVTSKSGCFDYNYTGNVFKGANKKIVWEVEVVANNGGTLENVVVEDPSIPSTANDVVVYDISSETATVVDAGNYTISNGKLKFSSNLKKAKIVYITDVSNTTDSTSNTATVGSSSATATVSGKYTPYTFKKSVSLSDGKAHWTITINKGTNVDLVGATITDSQFPSSMDDITITGAETTLNGNVMTINSVTSNTITIKYVTEAENGTHSNNATLTVGTDTKTASATYNYTKKNTLDKQLKVTGEAFDNKGSRNLTWEITSVRDDGYENVTISDSMSATLQVVDDKNNTITNTYDTSHYMTQEQFDAIQVYCNTTNASGNSADILLQASKDNEVKDYTITKIVNTIDGKEIITGFNITLNDTITIKEGTTVTPSDIHQIKVSYSSTADVTSDDISINTSPTFKNNVIVDDQSDDKKSDDASTTVEKADTKNQPFKKYPIDSNGKMLDSNATRLLSDIPIYTDAYGTNYYIFTWAIFMDGTKLPSGTGTTIIDTLPSGFTLYDADNMKVYWYNKISITSALYHTKESEEYRTYYSNGVPDVVGIFNSSITGDPTGASGVYMGGTKTLTFSPNLAGHPIYIVYSAKIKVTDFENMYADGSNEVQISNTLTPKGSSASLYENYVDTQTIKRENIPEGVTKADILDKVANGSTPQSISYTLDINKEGKKYSDSGTLTINDTLTITGVESVSTSTSSSSSSSSSSSDSTTIDKSNYDVGLVSISVIDPSTGEELSTSDYSYSLADGTNDKVLKVLQITVPDSKYVKVEYTYSITMKDSSKVSEGSNISTSNSASVVTSSYYDISYADATMDLYSNSSATVEANYVTISKYDFNDRTVKLPAGFTIAKWDVDKWNYASKITGSGSSEEGLSITWSGNSTQNNNAILQTDSTTGECKVQLEPVTLYKLIEVKTPSQYSNEYSGYNTASSEPIYFVTTLSYNNNTLNLSDIKSKAGISDTTTVYDLSKPAYNEKLGISNYQTITVTAKKVWSDGDENHSGDSVTVGLYKAYSLDGTQTLKETVILDSSESSNWTYTFSGLPTFEDDKPVYYFVKEISYTVSGDEFVLDGTSVGTYMPQYTGNGTRTTGTVVITNSKNLTVNKVWLDKDGKEIENTGDMPTVTFDLKCSTDGTTWKNIQENVALNSSNEWKSTFENLPSTDDNGNTYTYIVEEKAVQGYTTTYVSNATGGTGTITIYNKKDNDAQFQLKVEKVWADGSANHINEVVNVTVTRKDSSGTEDTGWEMKVQLDASRDWYYQFPVDANYTYSVKEDVSPVGDYSVKYTNNSVSSSSESKTITVTNTPNTSSTTSITVNKKWSYDANNTDVKLPSSIQVNIYSSYSANDARKNWVLYKTATIKPDNDNNWSTVISGLPSYLYYHVEEVVPDIVWQASYDTTGAISGNATVTITNTYTQPETFPISITKYWSGDDDSVIHNDVEVLLVRSTNQIDTTTLSTVEKPSNTITFSKGETKEITISNAQMESITISAPKDTESLNFYIENVGDIYYGDGKWGSKTGVYRFTLSDNGDGTVTLTTGSEASFNKLSFRNDGGSSCKFTYEIEYKEDAEPNQFTAVEGNSNLEVYTKESILIGDGQTVSVEDLPVSNGSDTYYYYVVEKDPNSNYTVSYVNQELSYTNRSATITNTRKTGNLTVNKLWINSDNDDITIETDTGVTFTLYRSTTAPPSTSTVVDGKELTTNSWKDESSSGDEEVYTLLGTYNLKSKNEFEWLNDTITLSDGKTINISDVYKIEVIGDNSEDPVLTANTGDYKTWTGVWMSKSITNTVVRNSDGNFIYNSTDVSNNKYIYVYNSGTATINYYTKQQPLKVTASNYSKTEDAILLTQDDKLELKIENASAGINFSSNNENIATITNTDGKYIITAVGIIDSDATGTDIEDTAVITIGKISFNVKVSAKPAAEDKVETDADANLPTTRETVEENCSLTNSKTFDNLPLADSDGNPYYYYVQENSGSGYITYLYDNNGTFLTETDNSNITITNKVTNSDDLANNNGITLPMTGGTGTGKYYLAGGSIVVLSLVLLAKKRRKQV